MTENLKAENLMKASGYWYKTKTYAGNRHRNRKIKFFTFEK
jgi:hypothetical protein